MKHKTTRRSFLERSARSSATVAAASLLGGVHAFGAISPNVLRFGLIGCGGMMKGLTRHLCRGEKVAIAWLCDVDPRQMDKVAEFIPADCQPSPIKRTARFEDVVGDDKVDACIIATPHHWHAPIALAAIESGKDVYIEKPISHVFDEGLRIISAAKKTWTCGSARYANTLQPCYRKGAQVARPGHYWRDKSGQRLVGRIRKTIDP